jgi:4-hydroxy 2-oxovalerate aldolase
VAVGEGATLADACLAGAGAGAGNCQMEALVAALDRIGRPTGIDLFALQDLAEEHVRPALPRQPVVDRITLTQGYAGVPGSFLLHAQRVAERFGVDPRDLMVEVGRAQAVSGQEDLLIEIAARRAAAGRSGSAG